MPREFINPSAIHKPTGYTHVVKSGNIVFIAGQVGMDRDGKVVGEGDIEAQTRQTLANLETAVKAAGGKKEDILSITTYILDRDDLPGLRKARGDFFGDNPPASTLLVISGLARPEFLIEIEARAVIGD
ncbi:MAG: RidA family protein [Chloroflexi bacterium]|nr:RidA family protein [Chloroflexota bacterium]MCZ6891668.1 RidA family protein [Chloroflexota bacterium]